MKPSILFVDDETNILAGLRRALRSHAGRWDLEFVPTAEAALRIIDKKPVHLVVTDMRMPGTDGAELLELLSQRAPHVFRFALSGESDIDKAIRIVGRSHRFLAKPIEPEVLVEAIDTLFSVSNAFLSGACQARASVFDGLKAASGRLAALHALVTMPERDHARIIGLVMSDPSLSLRLLQICNSAYFGKPLFTTRIPQAVRYVGSARLARLLEGGRLGTELPAESHKNELATLHAMAAIRARERADADGMTEAQQSLAYATALFSSLGEFEGALPNCPTKSACIAALFGLPEPLVASLRLMPDDMGPAPAADELATLAIASVRRVNAGEKEAA